MSEHRVLCSFRASDRSYRSVWRLISAGYIVVLVLPLIVVRPPIGKLVFYLPIAGLLVSGYVLTRWFSNRQHRQYRLILSKEDIAVWSGSRSESIKWESVKAVRASKGWLTIIGPNRIRNLQLRPSALEVESVSGQITVSDSRTTLLQIICDKLKISPAEVEKAVGDPRNKLIVPSVIVVTLSACGIACWAVARSHLSKNSIMVFAAIFAVLVAVMFALLFKNAGLINIQRDPRVSRD